MTTVRDIYPDPGEFSDLLYQAEQQAGTDWEINFVDDMKTRYDDYELGMYLSEKQAETLERIANS